MTDIRDCGYGCLTYTTPDGRYDVASYALNCPVHGWRWRAMPAPVSLEAAERLDRENAEREALR
jgi:hypothetical protein